MAAEQTLLDALYEAYNGHDAESVAALYASDGLHEDIATGRPTAGRAPIAEGLRRFFAAFPDAHWRCIGQGQGGDKSFGRYVLTGSLRGDLGPFRARGQQLELRGVHVLDVRDGVIQRSEDYWDAATFHAQMNHTPEGEKS